MFFINQKYLLRKALKRRFQTKVLDITKSGFKRPQTSLTNINLQSTVHFQCYLI